MLPESTGEDPARGHSSDEEPLEIGWDYLTANCCLNLERALKSDEACVCRFSSSGVFLEAVIEREMNVLPPEEEKKHRAECDAAKLEELRRWTCRSNAS